MKIVVVGVGAWGKNHVKTLAELRGEKLVDEVFVCDSDSERAMALAKEFDCVAVSFDDVKKGQFDGVVVATPSPTHYSLAKDVMSSGKEVLVEKPLAMSFEDSMQLVKQAEEQKRLLMVGHEFRFHPGIQTLTKMLHAGEFGKIIMLSANRFDFRAPRKDMGVLLALAIHDIDLFSYLLESQPNSVQASATHFFQQGIEDHCTLALDFANGVKCFAQESWIQPAYGKTREFIAVGTEKTVKIDFLNLESMQVSNSRFFDDGGILKAEPGEFTTVTFGRKEPLKEELKHFIECIRTRARPLADGIVGANAVHIIEKAFESIEKGGKIKI